MRYETLFVTGLYNNQYFNQYFPYATPKQFDFALMQNITATQNTIDGSGGGDVTKFENAPSIATNSSGVVRENFITVMLYKKSTGYKQLSRGWYNGTTDTTATESNAFVVAIWKSCR